MTTAKQAAREQQADSDFERRFRDTKHLVAVDDWEVKKAMYAKGWCAALDSAGVRELVTALEQIAAQGGNLPDLTIEKVSGINDGRSRAIMYLNSRQIAQAALARAKEGL